MSNICYCNDFVLEIFRMKDRSNYELAKEYNRLSTEADKYLNLSNYYQNQYDTSTELVNMFSNESVEMRNYFFNTFYRYSSEGIGEKIKAGALKVVEFLKKMWNGFMNFLKSIGRAFLNFCKMIEGGFNSLFNKGDTENFKKYKDKIKSIDDSAVIHGTPFRKDFVKQLYHLCDTMEKSQVIQVLDRIQKALQEFSQLFKKLVLDKQYRNSKVTEKDQEVSKFNKDSKDVFERAANEAIDHFKKNFNLVDLTNEFRIFLTDIDIKDIDQSTYSDIRNKIRESINTRFYGQIEMPEKREIKAKEILTNENLICLEKTYKEKVLTFTKTLKRVSKTIGSLVGVANVVSRVIDAFKDKIAKRIEANKKPNEDGTVNQDDIPIEQLIAWLKQFNSVTTNVIIGVKEYTRTTSTTAFLFRNQVHKTLKMFVDKNAMTEDEQEKQTQRQETINKIKSAPANTFKQFKEKFKKNKAADKEPEPTNA